MKGNSNPEHQLSLDVLEKMQTDEPLYIYMKAVISRVQVIVFNPITGKPEERILKGDPNDQKADKDEMIVKIYDEPSHLYFKNINKKVIEEGLVAPYKEALKQVNMINAITTEEIDDILSQPFFTLKNRIEKFTSSTPMQRILVRALELNKPVGTITYIEQKISEMQTSPTDTKALEDYYKNIQK